MEVLNWKNILLEWANRLAYLGRSYCSLNMVDIEAFYNEFRTNLTSKDIASKKLDSFMTSYFPEFVAEWTNEGKMSPDDYVYGFSLLMYFGCIMHPDKKIHKICGEMHVESQLAVKAFLKNLLDCNSFTRETIKCVIESSVPPKLSDYVLALSPNKISEINLCPATPKSKIVNEWYVENRQLKAQVESERFERGYLESQLKQKDDEINVLHKERRKFLADIQQLKSKLNEKDTENIPVNCNDSELEKLKRRLRKEICEKDAEINKLQTQVNELASSKQHLAEKLSHVESQYNESVECSAGLTERLEQLSETCDKQQEHIRGLEMNIKDYQKYFNESNSKGNSLDTSSENLEDSFAVAMANMSNQHMSSPENLGKVVDIKLREQMSICDRLQEKCDRLEIENGRLNDQVEEHVQRTTDLEMKCRQVVDENAANVQQKIDELATISKELESNVAQLQSLRSQFDLLTSKACENQQTIDDLTNTKTSLEQKLNECQCESAELRIQLEAADAKWKTAESTRSELVSQHEEIIRQKEEALAEFNLKNRHLNDQVDELRTSLSKAEQNYANLQTQNVELARAMELEKEKLTAELSKTISELADCQKDRDSIRQSVVNLTNQIESLTVERHNGDIQLAHLKSTNEQVLAERDQLRDKLEMTKKERIEIEVRLTAAVEIVRQKEEALAEFNLKNRQLNDQVDELQTSLLNAEQNYANLQTQNADLSEAMELDKEKLAAELCKAMSELADCQKDRDSIRQSVANLTDQIESLTVEHHNGDIQLAQLKSTNEQVLAERDQLRDKFATIEGECVVLQARLSAAESSRVDLEAQLNHSEDEKEKLFLNLQEKLDEVEATEMTVKEWSQRYESATTENRLVSERYEKLISDLNTTVSELRAFKESLTKVNNDLMKEASQMKTELESMRSEGERHMNEKKHFLESIEGLNSCQNTSEAEVRQLQEKLDESNNVCVELRGKCDILEAEIESLRKCVEDLESKRDTLTSRLDVAVRDVTDTRERLHQKDEEIKEMSKLIDSLKSESETSLIEKVKVETELRNNMDRLQRIGQELEEKKKESADASQLVDTLRNEVEQLKVTEMAMTAKNSELSDAHEVLVKKLESAENSKESLSLQCTSLSEELKAVRIEFTETELKLSDRCSQASERDDEVKALKLQVDSLKAEIVSISEVAAQKQSDLNAIIQTSQQEMATISSKAEEQQSSIKELTVQNTNLSQAMAELSSSLSQNKIERESYQRRSTDYKAEIEELARSKETLNLRVIELTNETKKLADELQTAKRENASLTDENVDLATEIEKVRTEFSNSETRNRDKIDSLKSELNRLETANSANHQRIDELQKSVEAKSNDNSNKENYAKLEADLKIAMSDLEAKIQECRQSHDLNAQLIHDSKILSAKLTQLRKTTAEQAETWQKERTALIEQNDKRCTEIRFEMEGKLSKMKERMKDIYNEETSKSKEKHEKQDRELTNYKHQCQLLNDKNDQYVTHVRSISAQLYKLNEQNLELKKETEFLKNKLRLAESNPSRQTRMFLPPEFGSNLKIEMEDEPGEVFNNTYLDELKSGTMSTLPVGRESIRLSELQQRNSMAAKHLRSTYAAQYGDQNLKEEDIAMPYFNDSMFSNNQLDVRRGTLYQRPGPPTPSKNGGRLSFGGSIVSASDLFPKDILREQNTNNAKTKTTPGKLMSMFSSSKHKENDMRKAITKPIYKTFTSTPRRKSIWAGERKSILAIKLNSTELNDLCDDDDAASIVSNDSLLSKTSSRRRSITHQFSIISKSKQVSAVSSLIHKNRCEYRKKNHSKRQKGFEQSREIFWKMDDDGIENDDDDSGGGGNNLQMVLSEEIGGIQQDDRFALDLRPLEKFEEICGIQQDDRFALDLRPSEKFEILTTRTVSEHPYSNEPTAIEAIEASEGSLTSSSLSRTMGNIIMYGKIPRITANEVPHRELIHLNQRSGSIWLKWIMGLTKECFLVLALLVVYASYVVWNYLNRKNE